MKGVADLGSSLREAKRLVDVVIFLLEGPWTQEKRQMSPLAHPACPWATSVFRWVTYSC